MGIFVTALTREKKIACTALQFLVYINVQDSSVFYIDFVLDSAFKGI